MIQMPNNSLIFFIRHGSANAETRQAKCFKDAKARAAGVAGKKEASYVTLRYEV